MTDQEGFDAAYAAFEEYRLARLKADRTLSFADSHDAAQAWVRFQNLYLGNIDKLAEMPLPPARVVQFPRRPSVGWGGSAA